MAQMAQPETPPARCDQVPGMKRACYRCDTLGVYRLSWLKYQKGPHAHDYACVDHAAQSQKWAIVTKSSEAVRW